MDPNTDPAATPTDDFEEDVEPQIPVDAELKLKTESAILETQRGPTLPISLGNWPLEQFYHISDVFPYHKFQWVDGELVYLGCSISFSNVRSSMVASLNNTISQIIPRSFALHRTEVRYGSHIVAMPDVSFRSPISKTRTTAEILWSSESVEHLERQLHWASSAGINAIGIKGWIQGKSGDDSGLSRAEFGTHAEILEETSVLLITKAAGSPSVTRIWRMGQAAQEATLTLPHTEEQSDIAWLHPAWFDAKRQDEQEFPFSLKTVALWMPIGILRGVQTASDEWWTASDEWFDEMEAQIKAQEEQAIRSRQELERPE